VEFPDVLALDGVVGFVARPFVVEFAVESESDEAGSDRGTGGGVAELEVDEEAFGAFGEEGLEFGGGGGGCGWGWGWA